MSKRHTQMFFVLFLFLQLFFFASLKSFPIKPSLKCEDSHRLQEGICKCISKIKIRNTEGIPIN